MKKGLFTVFISIILLFNSSATTVRAATNDQVYKNLVLLANASRSAGYTYTATCLENAICGYPTGSSNGDLAFSNGTGFSNAIKSSTEFNSICSTAQALIRQKKTSFSFTGSTSFTSNTDLYLSLHRANYTVNVVKVSEYYYNLNIVFTDLYNFESQEWESYGGNPKDLVVTYINNYAYQAQCSNIIQPFNISIFVNTALYIAS